MTPGVASFAAPPGLARDPLSEIWGDLSDADSAGLLADVRAHGVRQPILVDLDKGTVVDGWHRYRMAALAGRECPAIDVASWPAAEAEAAVQSSNRRRRHSSRKELLGAMARQRLTGEAAPSQTVEQEALFAGVTKRRYQQVLQATREELGLAPPNSGGRPPSRGTPRRLTWSGCWSFRRIPSRPWCGPPAPRLPVCPGPAGPAGRRAAILWPGLSRAALLVCPLHLGVGPINGDQADCVGRPPPGSTRHPGERLVFRLGEIEDDALVSLLDGHTKTPFGPRRLVPILATRWPLWGVGGPHPEFIPYTYHIHLTATMLHD